MMELVKTILLNIPAVAYFTFTLALIAFIFAVLLFNNKKSTKPFPLILGAIGIFCTLLSFYLCGDFVKYEEFGTPAQFGQFGDYIGGILNPIFGFITLVLVYVTYNMQRNSEHAREVKEKTLMYDSLITKRQNELSEIMKTEPLYLNEESVFFLQEIDPENPYTPERELVTSITQHLYEANPKDGAAVHSLCKNTFDIQNYAVVWRARKAIDDIRRLQIEMFRINEDPFFREYQSQKLLSFMYEKNYLSLILTAEIGKYTAYLKPESGE